MSCFNAVTLWRSYASSFMCFFFFQAEDGIRDVAVTGVQTCALPISSAKRRTCRPGSSPSTNGSPRPTGAWSRRSRPRSTGRPRSSAWRKTSSDGSRRPTRSSRASDGRAWGRGGTGRREGLKSLCPRGRAGSSPAAPTTSLPSRRVILNTVISSPGAIAFQIGPVVLRWYGILMATAIVAGLWLGHRQARREHLPADDIISCGQWAILAGLVGARLYEGLFNWDYYGRYPWKIIAVWEGGLAIHGGPILGPLVGAGLAHRWRLPVLRRLDVAAPPTALGQAIGRWGNFFNQQAFGRPTDLPWKLYISPPHRPPGFAQFEFFHPTFLYESLWDLLVFLVLILLLRSRLRDHPGALFFCYVGLYSVGRFAIEAIRLDSFWLGPFRVPQLASVVGVAIAVAGLAWLHRRRTAVV